MCKRKRSAARAAGNGLGAHATTKDKAKGQAPLVSYDKSEEETNSLLSESFSSSSSSSSSPSPPQGKRPALGAAAREAARETAPSAQVAPVLRRSTRTGVDTPPASQGEATSAGAQVAPRKAARGDIAVKAAPRKVTRGGRTATQEETGGVRVAPPTRFSSRVTSNRNGLYTNPQQPDSYMGSASSSAATLTTAQMSASPTLTPVTSAPAAPTTAVPTVLPVLAGTTAPPAPGTTAAPPVAVVTAAPPVQLKCPVLGCGFCTEKPKVLREHIRGASGHIAFYRVSVSSDELAALGLAWCPKCHDILTKRGLSKHKSNCMHSTSVQPVLAHSAIPNNTKAALIGSLTVFDTVSVDTISSAGIHTVISLPRGPLLTSAMGVFTMLEVERGEAKAAGDEARLTRASIGMLAFALDITVNSKKVSMATDGDAEVASIPLPAVSATEIRKTIGSKSSDWMAGAGPQKFIEQIQHRIQHPHSLLNPNTEESQERALVDAALACASGALGKAATILLSDGIYPPSADLHQRSQDLYPSASQAEVDELAEEVVLATKFFEDSTAAAGPAVTPFTKSDILETVCGLSQVSAPDGMGLRALHLGLLADLGFGDLVYDLCVGLYLNNLPAQLLKFLHTASMVPIVKKLETGSIRPIVLGSMFARVLQKTIARQSLKAVLPKLNRQLGIGTPQAMEEAALAVRAALLMNPDHVLVQIDFANAYGTMRRSRILRQLRLLKLLPLVRMFLSFYAIPADVHVRGITESVTVSSGVFQGDALGPMFFSLALQPLIDRLAAHEASESKGTSLLMAYLDDIGSVLPKPAAKALLVSLQGRVDELGLGLRLNEEKTVCFCPRVDLQLEADWPACTIPKLTEGVVVLGTPVGCPEWVGKFAVDAVAGLDKLLVGIAKLPSQHAVLLLRYCGVARINHLFRLIAPELSEQAGKDASVKIWGTLAKIMDLPTEEVCLAAKWDLARAKAVAALPIRLGGLNLTDPLAISHGAFVAGICDALPLLESLNPTLHKWVVDELLTKKPVTPSVFEGLLDGEAYHRGIHAGVEKIKALFEKSTTDHKGVPPCAPASRDTMFPFEAGDMRKMKPKLQSRASSLAHSVAADSLFLNMDITQRAATLSKQGPGASAFLHAIPSSSSLFMSSSRFMVSLRDRVFLPVTDERIPMCANATCPHDHEDSEKDNVSRGLIHDVHGRGCYDRHRKLVEVLRAMFRCAGIGAILEFPVGDSLRGDLAEFVLANNKTTVYDVTIRSAVALGIVDMASKVQGSAAMAAHSVKSKKYATECAKRGMNFIPLVAESNGLLHQDFVDLIKRVARRAIGHPDGIPETTTWSAPTPLAYWLQRISIAIQVGNADMYEGTLRKRQRAGATEPRDGLVGPAHLFVPAGTTAVHALVVPAGTTAVQALVAPAGSVSAVVQTQCAVPVAYGGLLLVVPYYLLVACRL